MARPSWARESFTVQQRYPAKTGIWRDIEYETFYDIDKAKEAITARRESDKKQRKWEAANGYTVHHAHEYRIRKHF